MIVLLDRANSRSGHIDSEPHRVGSWLQVFANRWVEESVHRLDGLSEAHVLVDGAFIRLFTGLIGDHDGDCVAHRLSIQKR